MRRLRDLLLCLTLFATPALAQRIAVFPDFVSGGGWSSEFFFTNQDVSTVAGINVSFFDEAGNALPVTSNLGVNSSFTFDLTVGVTQQIKVTPSNSPAVGYAVVRYPSYGAAVRASEIYRYQPAGAVIAEVGVPQQDQGEHFSFAVESDYANNVRTALALVNPVAYNSNPVSETLVLNLINLDGTIRQTMTVPLASGQHLSKYIDELFPNLGPFTGSMSISSPFGVGVLAVHQDSGAFGGISTDGGPVLGPFVLTSTPITGGGAGHDSPSTAQQISGSVIIAGTISQTGEMDSFKFTGKAGDIISVVCVAQVLGSYLDSVLEIYDGNLNPIAYNDQNGLAPQGYPENDSFIQMVLPADGTYYIVLSDYNGGGGSGYGYLLHIKLP